MDSIRAATTRDAKKLTEISFQSKAYWNYPEEYLNTWKKELTITETYLEKNPVHIFERDGKAIGYYSIFILTEDIMFSSVLVHQGTWLEHMFIHPDHIGQGVGKSLFDHMENTFRSSQIIHILADYNARGFYEKMNCSYIREFPSSIEGRTTPYLTFQPRSK